MNCKEFENRMIDAIENQLNSSDQEVFNMHNDSCASCKTLYISVKESYAIIDTEKQAEPKPFFETRLMQKLENTKNHKSIFSRSLQPVLMAASLALIISLGIRVGNYFSNFRYQDVSQENLEYMATYYLMDDGNTEK